MCSCKLLAILRCILGHTLGIVLVRLLHYYVVSILVFVLFMGVKSFGVSKIIHGKFLKYTDSVS